LNSGGGGLVKKKKGRGGGGERKALSPWPFHQPDSDKGGG